MTRDLNFKVFTVIPCVQVVSELCFRDGIKKPPSWWCTCSSLGVHEGLRGTDHRWFPIWSSIKQVPHRKTQPGGRRKQQKSCLHLHSLAVFRPKFWDLGCPFWEAKWPVSTRKADRMIHPAERKRKHSSLLELRATISDPSSQPSVLCM